MTDWKLIRDELFARLDGGELGAEIFRLREIAKEEERARIEARNEAENHERPAAVDIKGPRPSNLLLDEVEANESPATKGQIQAVCWPPFNPDQLKNALEDIPEWIVPALKQRGKRGKGGDSLWSPAMLAFCLCEKHDWKAEGDFVRKLTRLMHEHFPKSVDYWNELRFQLPY